MKKTALICTMIFGVFSTYAIGKIDKVELGLKAGLSTRDINTQQMLGNGYQVGIHSRTGFHTGLMGRVSFGDFHIQPEILYTTSACWVNLNSTASDSRVKMRTNTWDFPLLAGARFFRVMRAQVGPVFDLATDNTVKLKSGTMPQIMTMRAMMAYMVGLGVDLHQRKINIDLRFNGAFKHPEHSITVGNEPTFSVKTGMSNWMISAGYMF